jgi:hypothetical protein
VQVVEVGPPIMELHQAAQVAAGMERTTTQLALQMEGQI